MIFLGEKRQDMSAERTSLKKRRKLEQDDSCDESGDVEQAEYCDTAVSHGPMSSDSENANPSKKKKKKSQEDMNLDNTHSKHGDSIEETIDQDTEDFENQSSCMRNLIIVFQLFGVFKIVYILITKTP